MKYRVHKSAVAILCALCLILGSCICASAIPTTTDVTWASFENLKTVEYDTKAMVFNTVVNGKNEKLTLSFPSIGGMRIVGKNPGFFEPESTKDIIYSYNLDGTVSLTAGTGITVKVNINVAPWTLEIYNAKGNRVTVISSDRIWYGYNSGGTLSRVAVENSISSEEVIYGLGERFNSFKRNGIQTVIYNRDYWSKEDTSYKNIPIIHSSKGYSLYYNNATYAIADIGYTDVNAYSYDAQSNELDFFIWAGTPLENVRDYTALTGTSLMLPKWAYRYMPGATTIGWEASGDSYSYLTQSVEGHNNLGVTFPALFGEDAYRGNSTAYSYLNGKGIRLLGWTSPFQVAEISTALQYLPGASTDPADYELPLFRVYNGTYSSQDTVDFSHPAAKTLVTNYLKNDISLGMRGMMVDYGEYVALGDTERNYVGMTCTEAHNFNAYYYAKVYHDVYNELAGEQQWLNYIRSGAPGAQKYAAFFGGDHTADYNGYNESIRGMLSSATAGMSNYIPLIGGLTNDPTKELYDRWMQLGTFSPIMMTHGSDANELPWVEGTESVFLEHYWLRENLIDQIYSSAIKANKSGDPIVQPMAMAFPGKTSTLANEDQYIFAENFLVAPVTTEGATSRSVDLPNGTWVDLRTGTNYKGGKAYTMAAPQEYCPVLIRSGTVMPVYVSTSALSLFGSMSSGRCEAILLTAPNGSRKSVVWKSEHNGTTFNSVSSGNSFTVTATQTQTSPIIIAQGVKATAVKINGTALTNLSSLPTSSVGFYVDGNRTVIRVPSSGWTNVTITTDGSTNMSAVVDETTLSGGAESDYEVYNPGAFDKEYRAYPATDNAATEFDNDFDFFYGSTADVTGLTEESYGSHFKVDGIITHTKTDSYTNYSDPAQYNKYISTAINTAQKYKNFNMKVKIGLDNGTCVFPSILFGVNNPTGWHTENGGIEATITSTANTNIRPSFVGHDSASGGVKTWYDSSKTYDSFYGLYWYWLELTVNDGVATVKIVQPDNGNLTFSYTMQLPSRYDGGYVGLAARAANHNIWSIEITDLDTAVDESEEATKPIYDYPINDGTGEGMAAVKNDFDVYYKATATETAYAEGDFDTLFDTTTLPGQVILHKQPYTTSGDAGRAKTTILYLPAKFKNFEVSLEANSLNTSDSNYSCSAGPSIVFGVKDRTKWVSDTAGNGYEAWQYGFGGGFFFVGGWNSGSYVDRLLIGGNNGSNGWDPGFKQGRYFKVKVLDGTVTMSHSWDGESWTDVSLGTLPESYNGGYVGITFPGNATRLWDLTITNFDYTESTPNVLVYDNLSSATDNVKVQIQSDFDVYYSSAAKSGTLSKVSFTDHFEFNSNGLVHKPTETLTSSNMSTNITTMMYNKREFRNFEMKVRMKGSTTSAKMSIIFGVDDPTKWWTAPYGYKTSVTYTPNSRSYPYIRYYDESASSLKLITPPSAERTLAFKGFNTEFDFIVKVAGNTLTATVDYTAWGGEEYSKHLTIPSTYEGGKIGLVFVPDSTQVKSISITALEDGKKVLCVGDDVTADGGYTTKLQSILGDNYTVYNAGVAGKTASSTVSGSIRADAEDSIFAEHIAENPEIVVINYGASDALQKNWGAGNTTGITAKEHFKNELLSLAAAYKKSLPNAEVYIATSSASYTNDATYRANLAQVVEAQREVAKQLGLELMDVCAVTTAKAGWFPNGELPNEAAATFIADEIANVITGKEFLGDINDDGKLNEADIEEFDKTLLKAKAAVITDKTDLNLDGKVDVLDMIYLRQIIKSRA